MTSVLLTTLLFIATGWSVTRRLDPGRSRAATIAQAFLLGALAQSVVLVLCSELGIRWSRALLLVAPLLLGASARFSRSKKSIHPRDGIGAIELLVIAGVTLLHSLFATIGPLSEWDFLGIWGMKGNAFFDYRGLDWAFLQRPDHDYTNPDYPPLLPVVYAISALIRGAWEERILGLFTTFFGVAAAVIASDGIATRRLDTWVRIPAVLTVTLVAFSDRIGLAEAPLIAFTIAALLRIRDGLTAHSRAETLLGAAFLGAAAWTKNEGVALFVAVLAGMIVAGAFRSLVHLWPAVVLTGWWQFARTAHELSTARARGSIMERVALHVQEYRDWTPELFAALDKPYFWPAMMIVLAAAGIKALWQERFLLGVLLAQGAAIAAAYLVTHVDLRLELELSWERITHQLALVTVSTALLAWARVQALPDTAESNALDVPPSD